MLRGLDRGLAWVSWIAAALVVLLLFAGPSLIGAKKSSAYSPNGGSGQSRGGSAQGSGSAQKKSAPAQVSGSAVFATAGCRTCHTLKAAGATGTVGPDLDQLKPTADTVSGVVRSGGGGMPSFSGKLNDAQIAAVANYVSTVAGP